MIVPLLHCLRLQHIELQFLKQGTWTPSMNNTGASVSGDGDKGEKPMGNILDMTRDGFNSTLNLGFDNISWWNMTPELHTTKFNPQSQHLKHAVFILPVSKRSNTELMDVSLMREILQWGNWLMAGDEGWFQLHFIATKVQVKKSVIKHYLAE